MSWAEKLLACAPFLQPFYFWTWLCNLGIYTHYFTQTLTKERLLNSVSLAYLKKNYI